MNRILKNRIQKISAIVFLAFGIFLLMMTPVFGAAIQQATYVPLVGLPGITAASKIPDYINAVYLLTISLGALAGVLRIAWAGVKYSLSDVVTNKSAAKDDIQGVLIGLAILLIPFIVLNTINPNLTKLNVLDGYTKTNLTKNPGNTNVNTDVRPLNTAESLARGGCRQPSGLCKGRAILSLAPAQTYQPRF